MVFAVDGFETKVWGEREPGKEKEAEVKEILETEEADADEEDTGEEIKEDEDKDPAENEGEDEEGDDGEEEEEDIDQSDGEPSTDDEDPPASPSPSPPYRSHAEEQRALQAAERLLARTLAAVDAEGNGMSAEMGTSISSLSIAHPEFEQPRHKRTFSSALPGGSSIPHGYPARIWRRGWIPCWRSFWMSRVLWVLKAGQRRWRRKQKNGKRRRWRVYGLLTERGWCRQIWRRTVR